MTIKFLDLNILKGNPLDKIIKFVNDNDFDILHFQEISGGKLADKNLDSYVELKKNLPQYDSQLTIVWNVIGDKNTYLGNASFYKKSFFLLDKKIIWLKKYKEIENPDKRIIQKDPRCALSLLLQINQKPIYFINAHMAWGPNPKDTKYKLIQGEKLFQYINSLKHPFVLSGDFNVPPSSKIITQLGKISRNLTVENKINNTLNFNIHRAKDLLPANGLAVDYIFSEKSLLVNNFRLVDEVNLSDHFGVSAKFEI